EREEIITTGVLRVECCVLILAFIQCFCARNRIGFWPLTNARSDCWSFWTTARRARFLDLGLWTLDFGHSCIPAICPQSEHKEKAAKHVFAFGDPSDRFDMQRVHGEESSHQRATPQRVGELSQYHKQQDRVGQVQK